MCLGACVWLRVWRGKGVSEPMLRECPDELRVPVTCKLVCMCVKEQGDKGGWGEQGGACERSPLFATVTYA